MNHGSARSRHMPSAKKKRWSWSTGERGVNRLRVYENPQRGVIFAEFYERIAGEHRPKRQRISLGHADRDRAKQRGIGGAASPDGQRPGEMTLGALFDNTCEKLPITRSHPTAQPYATGGEHSRLAPGPRPLRCLSDHRGCGLR